jgi:hypothetical protein
MVGRAGESVDRCRVQSSGRYALTLKFRGWIGRSDKPTQKTRGARSDVGVILVRVPHAFAIGANVSCAPSPGTNRVVSALVKGPARGDRGREAADAAPVLPLLSGPRILR